MVFSVEFLHTLRLAEIDFLARKIPPGVVVLEVGAGTGFQARELAARGYQVIAIDLPASDYSDQRVFAVRDYDGRHFPLADASVNVVFSSNVLEHIDDLAQFHREAKRVLRPGGVCLHAAPSPAWRFWTTLSGYADLWNRLRGLLPQLLPRSLGRSEPRRLGSAWWSALKAVASHLLPLRHGSRGNALTELWWFSRRYWERHFRRYGFELIDAGPMGMFYTGYMFFGARWTIERRRRLARILGSACHYYVVAPQHQPTIS